MGENPSTSTDETPTPEAPTSPPVGTAPYRAFLLRLHFYAGIFVGPFLLIAAVSGGLYAIAPTIEQFVYRDQLQTNSSGDMLPVAEQVRAAQAQRPELTVTAVRPASGPGETTRVMFDDPSLGESERHAVFIDPVTTVSRGELTVYGSSGALPLRTWIDQLHRSLHLGEPGRLYSELAASWLWLIALAGMFLWWNRYRGTPRPGDPKPRLLTLDRTARGRTRTLNWHGAVGVWIAVGLLFLSATGLTWSRFAGDNVTALRAALSWTTPTVSTAIDGAPAAAHQHGEPLVGDIDRVLKAARQAGVGGDVEVGIPSNSHTAFTVAQIRQPWVMSNNTVAVDAASATVTDTSWFADWPLAAKLSAWGIQLHMGLLFGIANQLVLLGLALALVAVIVRGYLLWWQRRPTAGGRPVGPAPRRGVLTGLPPGAAVAVVLAVAAVGWFIPLLGVSLVVFVAVDVAVGWRQHRRQGRGR
ncbi:PepSY-associated TM helix domain-containing protein [Mycolicibacterium neworleansense]|uniref:PepSY-associated TM helix domain-containing protein n=1 Tax=Mycolicibacterium neworleansense TaxID=146018 RepID=A0A0H5RGX4_9MYCO|nr:PepSY-associated TM helix domain-containing protein [Mycolicibacterium neworleansense]MCV7362187.1 PepSY domain-containing protein [Mycolicibacterium neworleansense]CRZ13405.1 PepSY-associated TM helix domain-containing protein [Mycolicibacterium neworleansense]